MKIHHRSSQIARDNLIARASLFAIPSNSTSKRTQLYYRKTKIYRKSYHAGAGQTDKMLFALEKGNFPLPMKRASESPANKNNRTREAANIRDPSHCVRLPFPLRRAKRMRKRGVESVKLLPGRPVLPGIHANIQTRLCSLVDEKC